MIWEYCGNTEDYPDAARCYCCKSNVFHSREEHEKIIAAGWKPREHVAKHSMPRKPMALSEAGREAKRRTLERRRAYRKVVWEAPQA